MKDFPGKLDGPKGQWYRKVNERIAEATACSTVEELVEVLGKPDKVERAEEVTTPSKFFESIGSIFRFGDERAEEILTYVDPYRPRIRYRFGIVKGKVESTWQETVDDSRKDQV